MPLREECGFCQPKWQLKPLDITLVQGSAVKINWVACLKNLSCVIGTNVPIAKPIPLGNVYADPNNTNPNTVPVWHTRTTPQFKGEIDTNQELVCCSKSKSIRNVGGSVPGYTGPSKPTCCAAKREIICYCYKKSFTGLGTSTQTPNTNQSNCCFAGDFEVSIGPGVGTGYAMTQAIQAKSGEIINTLKEELRVIGGAGQGSAPCTGVDYPGPTFNPPGISWGGTSPAFSADPTPEPLSPGTPGHTPLFSTWSSSCICTGAGRECP